MIWGALTSVHAGHVEALLKFLAGKGCGVHINTGGHGDDSGDWAVDGEGQFAVEDLESIKQYGRRNVSVHLFSKYSGPIYPIEADQVIDAYCFAFKRRRISGAGLMDPVHPLTNNLPVSSFGKAALANDFDVEAIDEHVSETKPLQRGDLVVVISSGRYRSRRGVVQKVTAKSCILEMVDGDRETTGYLRLNNVRKLP